MTYELAVMEQKVNLWIVGSQQYKKKKSLYSYLT